MSSVSCPDGVPSSTLLCLSDRQLAITPLLHQIGSGSGVTAWWLSPSALLAPV